MKLIFSFFFHHDCVEIVFLLEENEYSVIWCLYHVQCCLFSFIPFYLIYTYRVIRVLVALHCFGKWVYAYAAADYRIRFFSAFAKLAWCWAGNVERSSCVHLMAEKMDARTGSAAIFFSLPQSMLWTLVNKTSFG